MCLPLTGASTMPVTFPDLSTSAPPDDAVLDAAPVSSKPLVVGPPATDTRLSVDATSPLLIQGDSAPGLGAATTHTESPVFGTVVANVAVVAKLAVFTFELPC